MGRRHSFRPSLFLFSFFFSHTHTSLLPSTAASACNSSHALQPARAVVRAAACARGHSRALRATPMLTPTHVVRSSRASRGDWRRLVQQLTTAIAPPPDAAAAVGCRHPPLVACCCHQPDDHSCLACHAPVSRLSPSELLIASAL